MKKIVPMLIGLISLLWFVGLSGVVFSAEEQTAATGPEKMEFGTIKGQLVRKSGKPFTPGFVAFFPSENLDPMDFGVTRRSPKMIAFLDGEGQFTTKPTPTGSYYIGAMERKGWRGGPPQEGEKRYSAFDDKGHYLNITLTVGQVLDIGTIVVSEPEVTPELTDFFTIEGKLLDAEDKPVSGAVVVVKREYNTPKAEFISDKSKPDGSYKIKLPPGQYYLLARETVEGSMRPKPDSIYGELGHDEPIGIGGKSTRPPTFITGVTDQLYSNVDIKMFRVPIPDVKRKETEALVKSDKYSRDDLAENLPLRKKTFDNAVKSEMRPAGEKQNGKP